MLKCTRSRRGIGMPYLIMSGTLFVLSLVVAAGGFTAMASRESAIRQLDDKLQAQKMLEPVVKSLRDRQTNLKKLMAPVKAFQKPIDVKSVPTVLRSVAKTSGLTNADFIPDAKSVVGQTTVLVRGRGMGTTDALRDFLVNLSGQSWVTGITEARASAGGDEGNVLDLTMRVRVRMLEEQSGGAK